MGTTLSLKNTMEITKKHHLFLICDSLTPVNRILIIIDDDDDLLYACASLS